MTIDFTGSPLLRLDRERPDDASFARHLADPQARLLRLDGLDPVLDDQTGALLWGAIADRDPDVERPAFVALSPVTRGKPLFVLMGLLAQLPGPDAAV